MDIEDYLKILSICLLLYGPHYGLFNTSLCDSNSLLFYIVLIAQNILKIEINYIKSNKIDKVLKEIIKIDEPIIKGVT